MGVPAPLGLWVASGEVSVGACLSRGGQCAAWGRKTYVSCKAGSQLCGECPFCVASLGIYSTNQQILNFFYQHSGVSWAANELRRPCKLLVGDPAVLPVRWGPWVQQDWAVSLGVSMPGVGNGPAPLSACPRWGTGWPDVCPESPFPSRRGRGGCSDSLPREFLTWIESLRLWDKGHLHGGGCRGHSCVGVAVVMARGIFGTAPSLLLLAL